MMHSAITLKLRRPCFIAVSCLILLVTTTSWAKAQQAANSDSASSGGATATASPAPDKNTTSKDTTGSASAADSEKATGASASTATSASSTTKSGGADAATLRELEELRATILKLEGRVEELESKVVKASADTTESVKEVKEVKADVATIQDAKKEEDKAISPIMAFLKATEISGFVDGYYSYSFNRPDGDLQLRNFDTKHNQFSLNLAKLVLEKKPTPDSRLGFRTDFAYGPTTEIVHASEPGGTNVFHNIEQAYVSYLAPVGKGLQLDFGKFVTWDGAEVIETKDNWNYSRSLLFALAIPYYHFGLRAVYPVSPKLTLSGYLVNGWNDVVANNHRKTFGFTAAWNPTPKLSIVQNYTGGATQPNDNKDVRHLYDTTVTYTVNPIISLMANYDYGKDAVDGRGVHWQGVAGYFKAQVNKWWALIPRFEWYDDHDGFTTGLAQTLKEITLTSEQKIYGNLLTRLEYRRDFSDENFFNKPIGRLVPAQSNVLFGIVYAFSSHSE